MELIQHIYQFKLPVGMIPGKELSESPFKHMSSGVSPQSVARPPGSTGFVNVYLIEGPEGNLLIDTGLSTPESYNSLSTQLKNYGFSFKDIKQIVVTHVHFDHSGQAGKIKQLSDARVSISQKEKDLFNLSYVRTDENFIATLAIFRACGLPENDAQTYANVFRMAKEFVTPIAWDNLLKNGDKFTFDPFEFTIFETPGHSPGHITLYEPLKKLLFTGDLILPEISTNISVFPSQSANPLDDYLKSLENIYNLEVNLAFPGHGPAFSGMRQIIEGLIRHHEERNRNIMNILNGYTKTAYQVAQEIPWVDATGVKFISLSLLDKRLAVGEATTHLEYLVQKREISKNVENGVNLYFA